MAFEQSTLLNHLGSAYTTRPVERLKDFAFLSPQALKNLREAALPEYWGSHNFVLEKYLAVHVPWAIEQGQNTRSENQFYMRAGHLQTRYGSPIYLVFEENMNPNQQPYHLTYAGSHIVTNDGEGAEDAEDLPGETSIPSAEPIPLGVQIEMRDDHIMEKIPERMPFLRDTPVVSTICAIAGAINWALSLDLQLAYWYNGRMGYLVPLYLTKRESIMAAPDAVAPLQLVNDRWMVPTILEPRFSYANARVAAKRHDELRPWMLSVWEDHALEGGAGEEEGG